MADVPATEEAVAAEFAIGGAAASFCGQWLCVKAGFEKKDGVVKILFFSKNFVFLLLKNR